MIEYEKRFKIDKIRLNTWATFIIWHMKTNALYFLKTYDSNWLSLICPFQPVGGGGGGGGEFSFFLLYIRVFNNHLQVFVHRIDLD